MLVWQLKEQLKGVDEFAEVTINMDEDHPRYRRVRFARPVTAVYHDGYEWFDDRNYNEGRREIVFAIDH